MKYPFYSGLSGKIAIIFLAGFILVVLPINVFVYNKLEVTIIEADNQQLSAEALKIISQTKLDPVVVPLAPAGHSIHIQVLNGQILQTIFSSPDFPTMSEELYFLETVNFDTLKILTKRGNIEGTSAELVVSVARSNRNLNEQLGEFRGYLFYLTGAAIIVMGILVFSLSGIMLKPFKNIVTIADKINVSGSMDRLPVPTVRDETRLLSLTLNNMLARIENSVNTQLQFFDSATHELKTPLTIMKGQLSLTLSDTDNQEVKKTLISMLEECERLERTISDFLLLSQLKNDNLPLRTSHQDLGEIVFATLAGIKKFVGHKNVSFQVTQSDTHFSVNVDKDKIQTVIFNVLENAVYHSVDGSVIKLNLSKQDNLVVIKVKNLIIKPIKNIELLGRERYTNSEAARGMGLGLWICSQILNMHKGELILKEENLEFEACIKLKNHIKS